MEYKISAAVLFARLREVAGENVGPALGAFFFLLILNTATDLVAKGNELLLISSIASFAAQYFVTRSAIDRLRSRTGAARVGGFFAVNLVTGLGILLGCVLLVLPGFYLAARWIAAPAYLLADDISVGDAISRSWEKTRSSVGAIMAVLLVVFVVPFAIAIGVTIPGTASQDTSMAAIVSILCNIATSAGVILSWLTGVAVFSLFETEQEIADVFA